MQVQVSGRCERSEESRLQQKPGFFVAQSATQNDTPKVFCIQTLAYYHKESLIFEIRLSLFATKKFMGLGSLPESGELPSEQQPVALHKLMDHYWEHLLGGLLELYCA